MPVTLVAIGARRTLNEDGTYEYDRQLVSNIDEIRLWNATLSADILKSRRKIRLNGTEQGLVAYYPFEKKTLDAYNQVVTEVREHFGELAYDTIIQRNIRLGEAPSHGKPVMLYDAGAVGSENYLALAREFLKRNRKRSK
jgi:chromosome partitioning protein